MHRAEAKALDQFSGVSTPFGAELSFEIDGTTWSVNVTLDQLEDMAVLSTRGSKLQMKRANPTTSSERQGCLGWF